MPTLVILTSPHLYCLPHLSHLKTQPDLILTQVSQKHFEFRHCTSLFPVFCWSLSQVQMNLKVLFNSQLGSEVLTSQFRFPGLCQAQPPTCPFLSTSLLSVPYWVRENYMEWATQGMPQKNPSQPHLNRNFKQSSLNYLDADITSSKHLHVQVKLLSCIQ